jgi:hypothetical protein
MNFYTYVVRFIDGSYYYGFAKSRGKNPLTDGYFGTPVTHKEKWLTTAYWKEILGSYVTFEEAAQAEQALIKPCYKTDPLCLNENCGGAISPKLCQAGGIRGGGTNKASGQAYEWGKRQGLIAVESGQLAKAREKIDKEKQRNAVRESGKRSGRIAVDTGQLDRIRKKAVEITKKRHLDKDTDGKSKVAKEMGRKSHEKKDENGKSLLAVSNGKKSGKLPWWYNPTTGSRKRQFDSPGPGWEPRRGPREKKG